MKIDLSKVEVIIIKDSDGNVVDRFVPKQVTHSSGGFANNALIFKK